MIEVSHQHDSHILTLNNLIASTAESNALLQPEEVEEIMMNNKDYNEVSEFKHLFDAFGCSFIPKDKPVKNVVRDFLSKTDSEDPFYIVDLSRVVRQMLKWRSYLPRVKPFYAVKCNPHPALLKIVEYMGGSFDCASKGEIAAVLSMGVDPAKRIIFANPCKQVSHIRYARSTGVEMVTVDNEDELYKLRKYWPEAKILIRIKTDDSKSVCQFSTKFGASLKDCPRLISVGKELGLNLVGISFHVGSGCMDPLSFVDAIKRAHSVFEMAKEQGIQFTMLDIGGGWPGSDEHKPSFETIADAIRDLMNELFPSSVEIIAEPGRYFASASHTLVTNVFARREVVKHPGEESKPDDPEVLYYINDGIYGSFNCIVFDHTDISIRILTQDEIDADNDYESESDEPKDSKLYKSVIFGPTCDSMDKLITGVELPKLNVGDWLYFHEFGAYTTASSSAFNGFKTVKQTFVWRN